MTQPLMKTLKGSKTSFSPCTRAGTPQSWKKPQVSITASKTPSQSHKNMTSYTATWPVHVNHPVWLACIRKFSHITNKTTSSLLLPRGPRGLQGRAEGLTDKPLQAASWETLRWSVLTGSTRHTYRTHKLHLLDNFLVFFSYLCSFPRIEEPGISTLLYYRIILKLENFTINLSLLKK